MCGIVGAVAGRNVVPILLEGLKRLEYRGYDSAGVAVLPVGTGAKLKRLRSTGRVVELEKLSNEQHLDGHTGIAHTRWATHGVPSERNAHPHISSGVSVVHNGIIENHDEIRAKLGTLATGVIYRHPGMAIKTATTLDVLSGGRSYFCIGAAWFEPFGFAKGYLDPATGLPPDDLREAGLLLVGTVDGVTRQLEALLRRLPAQWVFAWTYNGLVPHPKLMRSIEAFYTKVLPRVANM